MLISTQLFAAVLIAIVGITIFWSNPGRTVNRYFLGFSTHLVAWLLCVHLAVTSGEDPNWIRVASIVAAFVPAHMWFIKRYYVEASVVWNRVSSIRFGGWVLAGIALAAICLTRFYVLTPNPPVHPPHFGPGYAIYMAGELSLFVLLGLQASKQLKILSGVNRLELGILLLGFTASGFAIIALMALRVVLSALWPIAMQPIMLLLVYTATLVAVTTNRIFNARQIVLLLLQRFSVVATATLAAFLSNWLLRWFELPNWITLIVVIASALWVAYYFDRRVRRIVQFYPDASHARQAAFSVAQRTSRLDELQTRFENILKGWGASECAIVDVCVKNPNSGAPNALSATAYQTLKELRWVTPERLIRERNNEDRTQILQYLRKRNLGVLVISEGPDINVLIGVGPSATRLPYTYPQVLQLEELGAIFQSSLERVHFYNKAQHAEQLATVGLLGASVAHEIRNPLVTIKSFVQLLPAHYSDEKFRDKFFRLIGDEVHRIDRLTEQLLDLASPRAYVATRVELHSVIRATLDLVAAKAVHKDIEIVEQLDAAPDTAVTDAAAAKQVMLNLCFNAIQALENKGDGPRRLRLSTRRLDESIEIVIADNGPGIAPDIRANLFQPFQTTKSTGFGLGLAICSDILSHLNATISVDPPELGTGATFRVIFPCPPS